MNERVENLVRFACVQTMRMAARLIQGHSCLCPPAQIAAEGDVDAGSATVDRWIGAEVEHCPGVVMHKGIEMLAAVVITCMVLP